MGIEIQFCIKSRPDSPNSQKNHIRTCAVCGEGVLYYPDVRSSDIGDTMDTFRTRCCCTACEFEEQYNTTAPRYLAWRVVVSV